ncbi:hypothetical protein ACOME3_001249 [Neoechinorhynchus agilis]
MVLSGCSEEEISPDSGDQLIAALLTNRRKRLLSQSSTQGAPDRRQRQDDEDPFDLLNALTEAAQSRHDLHESLAPFEEEALRVDSSSDLQRNIFHIVRQRDLPMVSSGGGGGGTKRVSTDTNINEYIVSYNAKKRTRDRFQQISPQVECIEKIVQNLVNLLLIKVVQLVSRPNLRFPSREQVGNVVDLPSNQGGGGISRFMSRLKDQALVVVESFIGISRLPLSTQAMVRDLTQQESGVGGDVLANTPYFQIKRKLELAIREKTTSSLIKGKRKYHSNVDGSSSEIPLNTILRRSQSIEELPQSFKGKNQPDKSTIILSMSSPNLSITINHNLSQVDTRGSSYKWAETRDPNKVGESASLIDACMSPPAKVWIEDPVEAAVSKQRAIDLGELNATTTMLSELEIDDPTSNNAFRRYIGRLKKVDRLEAINEWLNNFISCEVNEERDIVDVEMNVKPTPRSDISEGFSDYVSSSEDSFDNGSSGMSSEDSESKDNDEMPKPGKRIVEHDSDDDLLHRTQNRPRPEIKVVKDKTPIVEVENPDDYVSDRSTQAGECDEVIAEQYKGLGGIDLREFFEEEAVQSGSDLSEDDEDDEEEEDFSDILAEDANEQDDEEQHNAMERLHFKRMREDDDKQLKHLKEQYLGQFEANKGREKAYYWKKDDEKTVVDEESSSSTASCEEDVAALSAKRTPNPPPPPPPPLEFLNCRLGHGCVVVEDGNVPEFGDDATPRSQKRRHEEPLLQTEFNGLLVDVDSGRLEQIRRTIQRHRGDFNQRSESNPPSRRANKWIKKDF